uniref:Transposase n=1 Tax=Ascaris lumbricoides TaxID=6252 RepID=A0A0M3I725_ASCLU
MKNYHCVVKNDSYRLIAKQCAILIHLHNNRPTTQNAANVAVSLNSTVVSVWCSVGRMKAGQAMRYNIWAVYPFSKQSRTAIASIRTITQIFSAIFADNSSF